MADRAAYGVLTWCLRQATAHPTVQQAKLAAVPN
jgi:hypothetical protein